MPKFFMPVTDDASEIIVTGESAHHIGYALRSRVGDLFTVCNSDPQAKTYGWDYHCRISAFDQQTVTMEVLSCEENSIESKVSITLYQAVPKNDKFDTIVQKAVELGAQTIVPVLSKRCISRPDEKAQAKKKDRLQKIALEAAKQCGRSIVPQIKDFISFEEAVADSRACDCRIICYEGGGIRLNEAYKEGMTSIALFVGSEGGFEPSEAELAANDGVQCCTLGKLILRCETAPIAAISVLRYLTEDI